MYCKNCGTHINDSGLFCKMCGTKISQPETPAPQATYYTKSVMPFKIISFIFTCIMLTLSFTKMYHIETWFYEGYFSFGFLWELFSDTGDYTVKFIAILLAFIHAWLPLSFVSYFVTEITAMKNTEFESIPLKGYGSMVSAIACIGTGQVAVAIINGEAFDYDTLSLAPWIYIVLILAIVNRFAILPNYLHNIQFNARAKKIYEKELSGGKSILVPEKKTEPAKVKYSIKPAPTYQPFSPSYESKKERHEPTVPEYDCESPSFEPVLPVYKNEPTANNNASSDTWQCFGCGMHNEASAKVCRGCNSPK